MLFINFLKVDSISFDTLYIKIDTNLLNRSITMQL